MNTQSELRKRLDRCHYERIYIDYKNARMKILDKEIEDIEKELASIQEAGANKPTSFPLPTSCPLVPFIK